MHLKQASPLSKEWREPQFIYKHSKIYILFLAMIIMFLIRNMAEISFGAFDYFPSSLILILSFLINSSTNLENGNSL
jgi:hypothetical protein